MKNVTLSLDDDLLKSGREYARQHHTTLNGLVRKLLAQTIQTPASEGLSTVFELADRAKANSKGAKWSREDLHDRKALR